MRGGNRLSLVEAVRATLDSPPPLPGRGHTAERHKFLFELGRRNLSLARLAEAHWDAVAILDEAGREPVPNAIYGVWAAEIPGRSVVLDDVLLSGMKPFCSGAGLIDRALVTVTQPTQQLIEVDLHTPDVRFDHTTWHTQAFFETRTCSVTFNGLRVADDSFVGTTGFYLSRPGFWHGACGPACCWAGGAAGLLDWALQQTRCDPHTQAHLGAMHSSIWALKALLETAGHEIDDNSADIQAAHIRALALRHLVELHATDILRRLPRAYGPHPLAFEEAVATRYQELDLYLRQSHAERDLAALGATLLDLPRGQ
jgi:hypothetical protein